MSDNKTFNFMGARKIAIVLSAAMLIVSIGSLAVKGLKFGLDFTGGAQVEVNFSKPADLPKIREILNAEGLKNPVAVLFGSDTEVLIRSQGAMSDGGKEAIAKQLKSISAQAKLAELKRPPRHEGNYAQQLVFTGVNASQLQQANILPSHYFGSVDYRTAKNGVIALTENSLDTAYTQQLVDDLAAQTGTKVELRRSEYVGPQVGAELRDQGGLGMLVALAVVMLYVAARFQFKFSVGAVLALVHDVIIVLGFFAFFQIDFDLTVLAAVLAVIGYSLNDTIVVFDRIRENFRRLRKVTPLENINISLTQTLERTCITSLTTLLVLVMLYTVGGEAISGFALALIVGIVVGTYSSIYVSANILMIMDVSKEDLMPAQKEGSEIDNMP